MTDLDRRLEDLRTADQDRSTPGFIDVARRRRRRRGGRVAASAGVVALVVAVALVLAPSPDSRRQRVVTGPGPTPTTTIPTSQEPLSPAAGHGMTLKDLTWISPTRGWALLDGDLRATSDGGQTWTLVSRPPPGAGLRFANDTVGYAFGPGPGIDGPSSLSMTTDGGGTWQPQPSNAVVALEPSGNDVIRITTTGDGCPGACAWQMDRSTVGSSTWQRSRAGALGRYGGFALVRDHDDVYFAVLGDRASGAGSAQASILISHDRGVTWAARDDPCQSATSDTRLTTALAAAPGGVVAVTCARRSSEGPPIVLVSTDHGRTFSPRGDVPDFGVLAVASATDLFLATSGPSGDGVSASHDGGRTWTPVVHSSNGPGDSMPHPYLGFQDAKTGRWIGGRDTVWTTTDGGAHWTQYQFT